MSDSVAKTVAPVRERGFVVFHDAYRHFEDRFGLAAVGSITVSPDVTPGADRVRSIRAKIQETGAACVFSEPQFRSDLVSVITGGAKAGAIDPLGVELENGPGLYFALIQTMADSIRDCLSGTS